MRRFNVKDLKTKQKQNKTKKNKKQKTKNEKTNKKKKKKDKNKNKTKNKIKQNKTKKDFYLGLYMPKLNAFKCVNEKSCAQYLSTRQIAKHRKRPF